MAKDLQFFLAKQLVLDNLNSLQMSLARAVEEGMIDFEDEYYNELLGLIEDGETVQSWDELLEVITRAKALEIDIVAWFSHHGRTTLSLSWPNRQ